MDEIAPEYDVVVLGTGKLQPRMEGQKCQLKLLGLTECVLSGYARREKELLVLLLMSYIVF